MMRQIDARFVTAVLFGLEFLVPTPARAGIAFTGLYAQEIYEQTSANVAFTGAYLSLSLFTTGPADFNAASVSVPGQTTSTPLSYNSTLEPGGIYGDNSVSTYFPGNGNGVSAGLSVLNTAYPTGIYTFTATNSTTNTSQVATLLYDRNYWATVATSSSQTAVPALTAASFTALQGMNAGASQTLNFNSFTGNGLPATGEVDPSAMLTIFSTTGQPVYISQALPVGTTSLQIPANTLQSNTSYEYQLEFLNSLHCGVGLVLCGTDNSVGYFLDFDTRTSGAFVTGAAATAPPTSLSIQGGTLANPVPLQAQGQIGEVDGLIGGEGAMDFYLFYWAGGNFMANAALTGADPNAVFEFELLDLLGNILQEITLDQGNDFSADLSNFISPGTYEIGLLADSPDDPAFRITFDTPVTGVPEPPACGLLALGLLALQLTRRRDSAQSKPHKPESNQTGPVNIALTTST